MATDRPVLPGRDVTILPEGLVAWRTERHFTQGALAREANVSEGLIALIETGKRQPSFGNALAIARALNVPLNAFAIVHVNLAGLADPGTDEDAA